MPDTKPTPTQEDDIFFPKPKTLKTIHGEDVIVPKVSWKKERQIIAEVKGLIQQFPDLAAYATGNVGELATTTWQLVVRAAEEAPQVLSRLAAIVLEKPEEWVDDNLDSERIISLLAPLFVQKANHWLRLFREHGVLKAPSQGQLAS